MLLYVWRRSGDPGLAFGLRRLPFAMDDSGGATDTPAPTVQVVADLDDGTRPAGVRQDAWEQMRATGNVERLSQRPGLTSTPAGRAAASAGPRVGGPAADRCRGASGAAWGMRVLRRNVELALLSPHTLDSADNQLDFIEELTEAVWDSGDAGFRHALAPAPTPDETVHREQRRRAVVGRLDEHAHHLCAAAEAWRDQVVATAEAARADAPNPQEAHRS